MTTLAAVVDSVQSPISVRELELLPPASGEVLVRMGAVGVCHSDWHLVTGDTQHPLPAVIGHEGSGTVEAVGEGVTSVEPGDRIALNWAPFCGACFYCDRGRPNLCETYVGPMWEGTMQDGTTRFREAGHPVYHYCALACFSERVVVPEVCCIKVADEVPLEIAAVIGCAVMTGVGSVLNTAQVPSGSSVVVFGAGGVGLSTVMGARLAGAETIIAVDPLASRREAALDLGATHALAPADSVLSEIRSLTGGRGADFVFEAAGIPAVQELALEAARPGGEIVFSGLSPMGSSTNLPGSVLVRQEKTVRGSYYGTANPPLDFGRLCAWYLDGSLPLDRLISRRYELGEINDAFADMLSGTTRRGVVVFD